ncbi:MAG: hypothetical protein H7833_08845 [Magnetococcus sp. DMHC-1]
MLVLSSRRIFWIFFLVAILLYLLDLGIYFGHWIQYRKLRDLFNITLEANIPTWFSSLQFMVTGLVAWIISRQRATMGQSGAALVWVWIALFFLFDGLDDTAQIHERLGSYFGHLARTYGPVWSTMETLRHFPSYYWLLCVAPFFIGFGLFMTGFLYREFSATHLRIIFLSAMVCYASAMALDYIEGASHLDIFVEQTSLNSKQMQHIFQSTEELIEMLGTALVLGTFLEYLRFLQGKAACRLEMCLIA